MDHIQSVTSDNHLGTCMDLCNIQNTDDIYNRGMSRREHPERATCLHACRRFSPETVDTFAKVRTTLVDFFSKAAQIKRQEKINALTRHVEVTQGALQMMSANGNLRQFAMLATQRPELFAKSNIEHNQTLSPFSNPLHYLANFSSTTSIHTTHILGGLLVTFQ